MRWIFLFAAVLGLSACDAVDGVTGSKAELVAAELNAELPKRLALVFSDTSAPIKLEAAGGQHRAFGGDISGGEMTMRLMRLPADPAYLVGEVAIAEKGRPSEILQALMRRDGDNLRLVSFDAAALLAARPIRGVTPRKDKSSFTLVDGRDAMLAFYTAAVELDRKGRLGGRGELPITIYDLTVPAQAEKVAAIELAVEEAKRRREEEAAEARRKRMAEKAAEEERKKQAELVNNKWFGKWYYRHETDPMTDKTKQYVYGFPDGYDDPKTSPYLRIGCYGATDDYPMGVTFYWGQPLQDIYPDGQADMARVTARFDKAKPVELGWSVSQDFASTYPLDPLAGGFAALGNQLMGSFLPNSVLAQMNTTWKAKDLHRMLGRAGKAVFRAYPRSGQDLTLSFDLSGYRKATALFQEHCNK